MFIVQWPSKVFYPDRVDKMLGNRSTHIQSLRSPSQLWKKRGKTKGYWEIKKSSQEEDFSQEWRTLGISPLRRVSTGQLMDYSDKMETFLLPPPQTEGKKERKFPIDGKKGCANRQFVSLKTFLAHFFPFFPSSHHVAGKPLAAAEMVQIKRLSKSGRQ